VFLSKIDIMDGFYRIGIRADDVPKLGIIFPTQPGEEPWIRLPLVLSMGWKHSPPMFTAATETVVDLANARFLANNTSYPRRLDLVLEFPAKAMALSPTTVVGPDAFPLSSIVSATDASTPSPSQ
jgi:hypothetical protein